MSLLFSGASIAQHQWTSLDGPYWANGKDVAYGSGGLGQEWHRYMIGSDGSETRPFYWGESNQKWMRSNAPALAYNKVISYKGGDNGHIAICSEYDNDVWRSLDGGVNWNRMFFPSNFNRHFSSLDVKHLDDPSAQTIVVASSLQPGLASAYYTINGGANWAKFGATGDPLDTRDVYDIETAELAGYTAGTSDGLYFHGPDQWNNPWEFQAFDECQVVAIENVDGWHIQQVAAVVDQDEHRKLYFSNPVQEPWDTFDEIKINNQSFDQEVGDIAAIYFGGPISCYVATTEGVFLLQFDYGSPSNTLQYDIKTYYTPMQYDQLTTAVDYYLYADQDYWHALVMASTPHNVYQIHTTYSNNGDVLDIEVSEIVTGTFKCNVVGVSFPENTEANQTILTVTENALVKKMDDEDWRLVGLGFEPNGGTWQGIDIATDFNGPDQDYVLVSSNTETNGTIMFSFNGGQTWRDVTPGDNHPQIVGVALEPDAEYKFRYAYAANDDSLWVSQNNGDNWGEPTYIEEANFIGVTASGHLTHRRGYAYGSGVGKVYEYDGSNWYYFGTGLENVDAVIA